MVNFLALLGWNPGTEQEIFTMDELIAQFSLERVQKAGAIFDLQKLDWLQGQWIRKIPIAEFARRILPIVSKECSAAAQDVHFEKRCGLIHERITFFHEAPQMLRYFYEEPTVDMAVICNDKQKVTLDVLPSILDCVTEIFTKIPDAEWNAARLLADVKTEVAKGTWKLGQLLWPVRASLTGLPFSPGAVEVAEALGKEKTMERLAIAKKLL
jgi:glutamyl-tRNA synthetase